MYRLCTFVLFLCCCEENTDLIPLWIDSQCSDADIERIYDGEAALNEMADELTGGPILEIQGLADYDHSEYRMRKTQTIGCYYEPEEWDGERWGGAFGAAIPETGVKLFFHRLPGGNWEKNHLVRHELVHYVWVRGHTDAKDSVMCSGGCKSAVYTQLDEELFCGTHECKQ